MPALDETLIFDAFAIAPRKSAGPRRWSQERGKVDVCIVGKDLASRNFASTSWQARRSSPST